MTPIMSNDPAVTAFLESIGVPNAGEVARAIIDINSGDIVYVYVTRYADARGFETRLFPAGSVQIVEASNIGHDDSGASVVGVSDGFVEYARKEEK